MNPINQVVIPVPMGTVTAYLVKGNRTILVDAGNPGSAAKILKRAAAHGIDQKQISLIVLTHAHRDHTGDLPALKQATGAAVAAHRDEAEALRRGVNQHLKPTGLTGRIFKLFVKEKEQEKGQAVVPDLFINKELDLKPYGIKGKIISTPGHTPGSVSVILTGGEAVIGDLLMGGFIRRRSPGYPLFAHDLRRVERSLKLVMKLKPRIVYASHGGPFKPEVINKRLLSGKKGRGRPARAK